MKIIKKNQIVIFVIALMLITAGYFNYNNQLSETSSIIETKEIAGIRWCNFSKQWRIGWKYRKWRIDNRKYAKYT